MMIAQNHDALPPQACPTCGRPYDDVPILTPFVLSTSGLLGLVLIAKEALSEVQEALEAEVLP